LRRQFRRWGLPQTLRVDNGTPWGNNKHDLPPALALWLIGLGVRVHWNDPCRPQQNGKVERSQGTGKRWAEPQRCRDAAELQRRLREADQIQRESYPAVGGRSRLAVFPGLRHSGRTYARRAEPRDWDLRRVLDHLAGYVLARQVSSSGHVSLYHHGYYVGQACAGQAVYVQLDPDECAWVVADAEGRQLRRHAAREVTREAIVGLNLDPGP
jgi:hypothetical protein